MITIFILALFFFAERLLPWRYLDLPLRRPWPEAAQVFFFLVMAFAYGYGFMFLLVEAVVPLTSQRRFTNMHEFSFWLVAIAQFLFVFVLLDFLIFFNHCLMHRIPFLWRLHFMHHAPTKIDSLVEVVRHPLELLLRGGMIWLLCFTLAVFAKIPLQIIFLNLLVGDIYSYWLHVNFDQRKIFGRHAEWIGKIFFFPGAHRMHHLAVQRHGNFGRALVIFDRLLGTHVEDSGRGDEVFGISPHDRMPEKMMARLTYAFRRRSPN